MKLDKAGWWSPAGDIGASYDNKLWFLIVCTFSISFVLSFLVGSVVVLVKAVLKSLAYGVLRVYGFSTSYVSITTTTDS